MTLKSEPHHGGRPPKFGEPSRPVTMTLPERVLHLLTAVDSDRAKAVTKLADSVMSGQRGPRRLVELVPVAPGKAVILVAHSAYLPRLPWLRLVELMPGRNLLSVIPGTSVEKLEVALGDLLEVVPEDQSQERELLETLRQSIRAPRRNQKISKEEILFVESALS
jgi:hypothetical protein